MARLDGIKHDALKQTIITMQNSSEYRFYGYYALYFRFIKAEKLPAAAGVSIINRKFVFYYNPTLIDEMVEKHGEQWLKFLIVHEVSHILLNHVGRTGDRDHQISNIAQDMLINDAISRDHGLSYEDFFYRSRDYPQMKFIAKEYEEKDIYEPLYAHIVMNIPESPQGEGGESGEGEGEGQGQGSGGDGDQQGSGSSTDKDFDDSSQDASKYGGDLVDYHSKEELSEQDQELAKQNAKEIAETLKQRGFSPGDTLGKMFNYKKQKTVINVFKRVFSQGQIRDFTYKKLHRRLPGIKKGIKKENRDVNVILDTSGSLFSELDQYIGQLVGKYQVHLVQIDTQVAFSGKIKTEKDWKKVKKMGGGGTILQPAFEHLHEINRSDIPTVLVSDFYCENLDLSKFKAPVTFVKSKCATDPQWHGSKRVKVIESKLSND